MSERTRVLILGAGGRDFHVFNTCYRDDAAREVVAFTATQIPHIENRTYPAALAGPLYPLGIPIVPEARMEELVRGREVRDVVFAYSDVPHTYVESIRRRVEAAGARFATFDPEKTMLTSRRPCVAVCAVRTGCGKSAVSRHVAKLLRDLGRTPAILRHPMPYGNLERQAVQRFATREDLDRHECTIEEREEYEPHLAAGNVVFAGADYARILAAAEEEGDTIVWDGGNNDTPFVRPDVLITIADPLRSGDETTYFPGRWNFTHADVIVINKVCEAKTFDIEAVRRSAAQHNPEARVVEGRSPIVMDDAAAVRGKRALVVEDGPTATHGGMGYGAGLIAALRAGAAHVVDPRPFAKGGLAEAYRKYPHLRAVVPALGYGSEDVADLEATLAAADCDVVVVGTPIDLCRLVRIDKPCVRVTYGFEEASTPGLGDFLAERLAP